jgi:tRNA-modifying protein YgfZ
MGEGADSDIGTEPALSSGAVLFNPRRDVMVATGADRVRFLHGIVTANVAGTPVGGACHATLLTAKANVVAEMRIFVRADELFIVGAQGQGLTIAAALTRYAIMDDFSVAPADAYAVHAVLGPQADARLAAAGVVTDAVRDQPVWSHAEVPGPGGTFWLVRARQLGADGYWLGGPAERVAAVMALLRAAGVVDFDPAAAEVARISAGEPAWGHEITDEYFPMEVGLGDTIDYTKGCFLGQEPIVRIRDRGHINWRLVRLDVEPAGDGDRAPASGDRLQSETKPKAGRITSAAHLPGGRGVALAVAHVSVPPGATVTITAEDGTPIGRATVIA